MLLREVVAPAFAVGAPALADVVMTADIPKIATATLLIVIWQSYRLGRVEQRLDQHGRILESHGRILESLKHGFEQSQGIANRSG